MDPYLGEYMRENYPELEEWEHLSTTERYDIAARLRPRERAWIVTEKMGKFETAKKLWLERFCENERHHTCPHCGGNVEFIIADSEKYLCLGDNCPYMDDDAPNPWLGCNHGDLTDDSCGAYRWDKWDQ